MKNAFNTDLRSDVYQHISFRFCVMVNTIKLYSLIPVLVILLFSQGHRDKCLRTLQLVQPLTCKRLLITLRDMHAKDCYMCGVYGSF